MGGMLTDTLAGTPGDTPAGAPAGTGGDTRPVADGQEHHPFIAFYNRFFERYTFTEFVFDVLDAYRLADGDATHISARLSSNATSATELSEMLVGAITRAEPTPAQNGCTPKLFREALNCFLADTVRSGHREALFSIRMGGISTRTIRNWKKDGNIYSARSSKTFNGLFDRLLPSGVPIDRKRLAWLWLAERLKLNDAETNRFLKNCMGEQSTYALDLYEVVLRAAINANSRTTIPLWKFFDAVNFCLMLQEEVISGASEWRIGRNRVLEALRRSSDGDARDLADKLSLIYEDVVGYLGALSNESASLRPLQEVVVTQMIEERYLMSFESTFTHENIGKPDNTERALQDLKAQIAQWTRDSKPYLQAAYLSGLLTVVKLLIDFAVSNAKTDGKQDIFKLFYFNSSRAVTPIAPLEKEVEEEGAFPENIAEMTSILTYEEGEAFERFAREKCLIYFERMLDAPTRISRRHLIEFYLLTRLQHAKQQELDFILARHRFRELGEGDEMLLHFFDTCAKNPPKTSEHFAQALATFKGRLCRPRRLPHGEQPALDWPVQEKLFRWKYGCTRNGV
jgi:hypothetical protein